MPDSVDSTNLDTISNGAFGLAPRLVGDTLIETVDARRLHAFLQVGKDFSTWIKDRVAAYGFTEDVDFMVYSEPGNNLDCSPVSGSKGRGGHNRLAYAITLDMAKELSMVERNEQGKRARRYFIECERRVTSGMSPQQMLSSPAALRTLLLQNVERVIALQGQVAEMQPTIEAYERIAAADGSLCVTDAAKALQVRPKDLFGKLQTDHWIYRRTGGKGWLGYQSKVQTGLVEHKVETIQRPDGSEAIREQVRITPKGLAKLAQQMTA